MTEKNSGLSNVRSNDLLCRTCGNLRTEITRHGLRPRCKNNVLKFKEREKVDFGNDKDLKRTCHKYIPFKT